MQRKLEAAERQVGLRVSYGLLRGGVDEWRLMRASTLLSTGCAKAAEETCPQRMRPHSRRRSRAGDDAFVFYTRSVENQGDRRFERTVAARSRYGAFTFCSDLQFRVDNAY